MTTKFSLVKYKNLYRFSGFFLSLVLGLICFSSAPTFATSSLLNTGIIVLDDETGDPLIGVNVYAEDQSFITATDLDGKALIPNIGYRDPIIVSYTGYTEIKTDLYNLRKSGTIIRLKTDTEILAEVVVVGRRDDPEEEIPYILDRITAKEIQFTNAQTTVDAINKNGDVYVQKSQGGGGSPILRGFEANKVLLVIDGVRMNNAIYRSGHLQNAITVDNSIMEQIEVIHGPGSLLYGSDALGGVVHFRTKDPQLLFGDDDGKDNILNTNVHSRFSSANLERSYHFDFNYGTRKVGWLFSSSYNQYGDVMAGSLRPEEYPDFGKRQYYVVTDRDPEFPDQLRDQVSNRVINNPDTEKFLDKQTYTGYNQFDVLTKLKIQPNNNFYLVANFQYSNTDNVPRYDNLTDTLESADKLKWSEWYYGPQKRLFSSLKARILKPSGVFDRATFIGAFQDIDESRYSRKYNRFRRDFREENVKVISFTADFDKFFDESENHTLSYGFEGNHNIVRSSAGKINTLTDKITGGEFTRYPSGGSTMTTYAGYLYYKGKTSNNIFSYNAGARYSNINIDARFSPTDPVKWGIDGIQNNMSDITGSVGLSINTPNKWQVHLLASRAFRAPNLDDFAKVRPKNGFITIPNANLEPEKAWNSEITIAKEFGKIENSIGSKFKLSTTAFYTYLTDAIVRIDSTLNGETILSTDDGPQTIQTNVNASTGFVYGLSINAKLNIKDNWELRSSFNYVKGRSQFTNEIIDTLVPLAHIPPMYGRTSVAYQAKKFKLELMTQYNAAKQLEDYSITSITYNTDGSLRIKRTGSSDNIEYTPTFIDRDGNTEHAGTYGWFTTNFYSSFNLGKKFKINLAVENIFDVHYRTFSSGISAPGRNFVVGLYGNF